MTTNYDVYRELIMMEDVPGYHEYRRRNRKRNAKITKLSKKLGKCNLTALISFIIGFILILGSAGSFDIGTKTTSIYIALVVGGASTLLSLCLIYVSSSISSKIDEVCRVLPEELD